jgi:hypothetical protein
VRTGQGYRPLDPPVRRSDIARDPRGSILSERDRVDGSHESASLRDTIDHVPPQRIGCRWPLDRTARAVLLLRDMTHDDVFDDDTVIALVRADDPPALPFALRRRVRDDEAWLATLPPATRAVLEDARRSVPVRATSLLPGAVVRPVPRIPSLRPPR